MIIDSLMSYNFQLKFASLWRYPCYNKQNPTQEQWRGKLWKTTHVATQLIDQAHTQSYNTHTFMGQGGRREREWWKEREIER